MGIVKKLEQAFDLKGKFAYKHKKNLLTEQVQ